MNSKKVALSNLMNSMTLIKSPQQMLDNYEWYSLASGVKDDELTKKLMIEIIDEKTYLNYIRTV